MFDLSAFALLLEKMIFFINALTQKDNRSVITSEHNIVVALFFVMVLVGCSVCLM